jgi:hypothetical protein
MPQTRHKERSLKYARVTKTGTGNVQQEGNEGLEPDEFLFFVNLRFLPV